MRMWRKCVSTVLSRGFGIKWFICMDEASKSRDGAVTTRKSQRCGNVRGDPCEGWFGEKRVSERSFNARFIR